MQFDFEKFKKLVKNKTWNEAYNALAELKNMAWANSVTFHVNAWKVCHATSRFNEAELWLDKGERHINHA
ncbi:hypothetical protein [Idiomarina piscisalsi]|uniref:Uncharacterized protein n=1 Tax=Idiomarina piscisalsi TaxID=1096243 RepID=A0A432YRS5_9GAMM|nr:hypothetical protein [Idiomarina piscisalsi]RUO64314.1 hypothetical protein CWI73_09160 [Idiomarina piscisalsi]